MDSAALLKKLFSFQDEQTGVSLRARADENTETDEGLVAPGYFIHDGEPIGRVIFRIDGDKFEVARVNLGSFAGQGVMSRYADFIMPTIKAAGIKQIDVVAYGGAETICKRHGLKGERTLTLKLSAWKPPTN